MFRSNLKMVLDRLIYGKSLAARATSFVFLCIAAIWALTVSLVVNEREQAIELATSHSASLSSVLAGDVEDVFERIDVYRHSAVSLLAQHSADATTVANPLLIGDAALRSLAVFDAKGRLSASSRAYLAVPEIDRLVAQALHVAHSNAARHFDVIPVDSGTEGLLVRVAQPLYSPQSRLLGILVVAIDVHHLLSRYEEVSRRTQTQIRLLHENGQILARLQDGTLSAEVAGLAPGFSRAVEQTATGTVDSAETLKHSADQERVGVYRVLGHIPVSIEISQDTAAVVGGLASRHYTYYGRAGVMSAALIVMMAGFLRVARRQERLYEDLAWTEARKRELIDQLEAEKSRAVELASYDFLTGLPNRMMFHRLATAELARARRSRRVYALYFLDLDKFKMVNDTLGHAAGDLLLRAVAERLRTSLREYDLIARLGGDEFVVLVSELESTERVGTIAAKLVEALSVPYPEIANEPIEVTPSIGIALYPGDGQDIERLLSNADAAMYEAKRLGRGQYRYFDGALNTSSARKLELISRFRRAIREGEFRLHYQMRVGLNDMRPVGMEALVRWQHPVHGLIYPGEFIDLAEEHDFIVPLGHWIIDAACAQLAAWRALDMPLVPVAINISAKQLRDEKLVDVVLEALARYAIPPQLLEIEVTESCFLERLDIAKWVLEQLDAAQIKISLDDYGTGFSGLSRLKQLPIRAVKIDRSFIHDIRNDTSDAMIVSSTISLSHSLGLKVVAEGVETKEQLVHLKAAGCDEVQGFYCHRPCDADAIAAHFGTAQVRAA